MKKNDGGINMTEGAILPLLIRFTVPIMLSGLLQQLYGAMDSAVVGQFSGPDSLGAVGSTASLTNLIIAVFLGMSTGAGIIVAQLIGADDAKGVKKTVHTSIALAVVSGIFLTVAGGLLSGRLLKLMDTPPEVLPLAKTYMQIYFLGSVPSLVYNFGSGILRAAGDSRRPLEYLCAAAAVNIVFNLIFVIVFKLDVTGVAISTIMSQTVSAFLVVKRLIKTDESIRLYPKEIRFDKKTLMRVIRVGLPAGIQGSVFSFSNTVIQSTVNKFGNAAVAGCAASSGIENFVYFIMNSIALAATTYIGQNFGAAKYDRCSKGFRISVTAVTTVGIALGICLGLFKTPLLRIFTGDADALSYGAERLTVFAFTYFLCGVMDVICGTIRGYGDSLSPMLIALIGVTGSRMLWIFTVLPHRRTVLTLYLAFPVSWIITIAALCIRYALLRKTLKSKMQNTARE